MYMETDPRTAAGRRVGAAYFATLSVAELRRRQDLTSQQINLAYRRGLTESLEQLQVTHDLLSAAVYAKEFGVTECM
jgi:hypothetical protein